MFQPIVINLPGCRLGENPVSHNRRGREQTKKAKLRQPTKAKLGIIRNRIQPCLGCCIMDMATISQCDPHIDVREKE